MRSVLAVLLASATTAVWAEDFNPVRTPSKAVPCNLNAPCDVTWDTTPFGDKKITLKVVGGCKTNALEFLESVAPGGVIATGIDVSAGKFTWNVPGINKVGTHLNYGILASVEGAASPIERYTEPFQIIGNNGHCPGDEPTTTTTMTTTTKPPTDHTTTNEPPNPTTTKGPGHDDDDDDDDDDDHHPGNPGHPGHPGHPGGQDDEEECTTSTETTTRTTTHTQTETNIPGGPTGFPNATHPEVPGVENPVIPGGENGVVQPTNSPNPSTNPEFDGTNTASGLAINAGLALAAGLVAMLAL